MVKPLTSVSVLIMNSSVPSRQTAAVSSITAVLAEDPDVSLLPDNCRLEPLRLSTRATACWAIMDRLISKLFTTTMQLLKSKADASKMWNDQGINLTGRNPRYLPDSSHALICSNWVTTSQNWPEVQKLQPVVPCDYGRSKRHQPEVIWLRQIHWKTVAPPEFK